MMMVYLGVLVVSVGLLTLAMILDGIFDSLDGMFDWVEGIFDIGDVDVGGGESSSYGSQALFAGFMGFGASGALATYAGLSTVLSAFIAAAGFFIVGTLAYLALYFLFSRTEGSSDVSRSTFTGAKATVTSTIPEQGLGMVQVIAPGTDTLVAEPAKTAGSVRIATGSTVVVDDVVPGALVVSAISEASLYVKKRKREQCKI